MSTLSGYCCDALIQHLHRLLRIAGVGVDPRARRQHLGRALRLILDQMVEQLLGRGSGAVRLKNAARPQQRGNRVLAALHLRIQAQCSFQIAAPLRDQSQVIKGIVDEFAHRQQFREAPARRIELAVLKFDEPQEPQRHRRGVRLERERLELRDCRVVLLRRQ